MEKENKEFMKFTKQLTVTLSRLRMSLCVLASFGKPKLFFTYLSMNDFFGGTELENGFQKSKHFTTYWLKAFSSDTPQSIKRQNKGPKEQDEKYIPSCGSK